MLGCITTVIPPVVEGVGFVAKLGVGYGENDTGELACGV
jgi:hypothetical protein